MLKLFISSTGYPSHLFIGSVIIELVLMIVMLIVSVLANSMCKDKLEEVTSFIFVILLFCFLVTCFLLGVSYIEIGN